MHEPKPQKILIAGGTGMLGHTLGPWLESRGFDVRMHGMSSTADCNADLTIEKQSFELLDHIRPNTIVNLAALTNVDECEKEIQKAYLLNVKIVQNLSMWCRRNNVRLVHISTDHIYDGVNENKESELNFKNVYALSKFAGELAAQACHSTTLRTNFFGKSLHSKRKSFSDWIVESLKAKRPISVFNDVFFSPLSMNTLSKAIERAVVMNKNGIYNLGSREGMSKAQFAQNFAELLRFDLSLLTHTSVETNPQLVPRPKGMKMDVSLFEKTFDFRLPLLSDEIKSQKEYYEKL